ncbi:hypothetical protein [Proteus sp. CD3]|uniref:hypothetical protein n=1 Tax=Proteus sp. CD3 TaxID=1921565 RepID=UPI00124A2FF3|nr:hypothetical protein [Proteus sp. CD3]QEZ91920.1 hypothetical protein BTA34_05970 [Proteus sp. CD3]
MKLENKLMLRVFGASKRGKTQTLIQLIRKLKSDKSYTVRLEPKENPLAKNDEIAIFEKDGLKIGISTGGDNEKIIRKAVEELIEENCNFIISATRTRGQTKKELYKLVNEHEYQKQWFKKNTNIDYWCNKWPHKGEDFDKRKAEYFNKLNETDAQFLFDYIDSLTK